MRYFQSILIALIFTTSIWAAGGKISGTVTDEKSGEPLPGVNVYISELSLGAATDLNGYYVILNVVPGNYTLKASYIGYATYSVINLGVSTGQTTIRDFRMSQEVLQGQEVVVTADRPLVRKDLTASQKITTSDEIKDLPVETFLGVLTTQAGVNVGAGGELHIRGGRSNEVGYYIDGISVANPFFTNGLAVSVSNKALQEMKVVSGAFNAEYGNAMSGIVNIQIAEGGPNYSGNLSVYTGDYLSDDSDLFMNIDKLNFASNKVMEGTFTGPVPLLSKDGNFTFNVSGRYTNNEGYLYGRREHNPNDYSDFRYSDFWYIENNGDNEYVPMNPSERLNLLTKLTYRITPKIKLSTQLIHDDRSWKSYVHLYKFNPDGIYNYNTSNNNYSIKLSQAFTKTYYEANFFIANTEYERYVYADTNAIYIDTDNPGYVSTNNIQGAPPTTTFVFGGTQMGHLYRNSSSMGGKFDITSQITQRHELKSGLNFRIDDLEEDFFTVLYDNQTYTQPTVLPKNESPSHSYYNKQAMFTSAYIQDKIEYPNMVINAGLRYDYFDPNDDYIVDLLDPEGERKDATTKQMISPRFGVSFPITDEGILHFSYGHFYQLPPLNQLYRTRVFGANQSPTVGYANLKPEKTVLYEFGLQQQFTNVLAVDVSAFYKDIRDLLATQSISYLSSNYGPASYSVYLNKDFGSVKGLTVSLTKRWDPKTKTSAFLDYSYQITEGNSVTSGSFYFNSLTGEEEEKRIVPLSWDQPHILNATITISEPQNWGLSIIGKMSAGWPYTPNIPNANYVPDPNSQRKPLQKSVNLRVFKNLSLGMFDVVLFAKVFNLFDTRNERYVFNDTGRAGYTYATRSIEETDALTSHYGETGVHTWEEYQQRASYYSTPRSVQFGLSLEF